MSTKGLYYTNVTQSRNYESNVKKEKKVPLSTLHLVNQPSHICDPQIYIFFFPHFFHLFITINSCYPSLLHVSFFHLKQVQYVTIL